MYNNSIVDIYVMNHCSIHVDHSRIISEGIPLPSASAESGTIVAISVIHATIETDMRSPVSTMKSIITTRISPIGGCP
jgi:hypothetical protein